MHFHSRYRSREKKYYKTTSVKEYAVGIFTIATMHVWTFLNYKFTIFDVNKKALEHALNLILPIAMAFSIILWLIIFITTFKIEELKKERKWLCINSAIFCLSLLPIVMTRLSDSIFTDIISFVSALNIFIICCMREEVFDEVFNIFGVF